MIKKPKQQAIQQPDQQLGQQIGAKAQRKIRAQRQGVQGIGFGLRMMGLIGWSIALPTLLGAALGLWLEASFPGTFAWTLSFLVLGLCVGCLIAWRTIWQESSEKDENAKKIEEQKND
jgi:ATP synthase protein I